MGLNKKERRTDTFKDFLSFFQSRKGPHTKEMDRQLGSKAKGAAFETLKTQYFK